MQDRQVAVLDALQRTQRFLDENATLLASVDFTTARRRLDNVVTNFTAHAIDQSLSDNRVRGETKKQRQLRLELRRLYMKPIAVIVERDRCIAPGFTALQMPNWKARGEDFLFSARDMLAAATIHRDTLIAHGLPMTLFDDFRAALKELSASVGEREKHRATRYGATRRLGAETRHGRTVLNILDALVRQASGNIESVWCSWHAARLIRRGRGKLTKPAA